MLIFSVSFQFYRMRRVLPRSKKRCRFTPFVPNKKKRKEKKRKEKKRKEKKRKEKKRKEKARKEKKRKNQKVISQREARTLNLPVNSRARCQLRHPGNDNFVTKEVITNTSLLCNVRGLGGAPGRPQPPCVPSALSPGRGRKTLTTKEKKKRESIPGLEPGISCSVGRRLIHWAIRT
jgi:hypothetical protein